MSSQYNTEPPPTATVLLHTTAGPLTISLFAQQTPLTCRNFLQHVLDGYYDGCIFHRVSSGFVIQTGDPTGTGEGGQNIYDDREFERYDADWAKLMRTDEGERISFGDELHTRLKFNRRGLVGMAKSGSGYGSQFFITLGDCRAELDGKMTMFGRVEGDGIYNVVKVSEAELIEGTERPMYAEKILRTEVVDMPKGVAWQKMSKRQRIAARTVEDRQPASKKKPIKKKGGKALLSFGDEEGEGGVSLPIKPKKAKFNTALIDATNTADSTSGKAKSQSARPDSSHETMSRRESPPPPAPRPQSPSPRVPQKRKISPTSPSPPAKRKPSFHDSTTQLPIRNPESPSVSPSPSASPPPAHHNRRASNHKSTSQLESEIAALKASMRRDNTSVSNAASSAKNSKKSALESLIPATSTRGRKRPTRPGDTNSKDDTNSLKMLDAFRKRLESATTTSTNTTTSKSSSSARKSQPISSSTTGTTLKPNGRSKQSSKPENPEDEVDDDEEARLCDLHFIANCQSCFAADHHHHHSSASSPHNRTTNRNHNTTTNGAADTDDDEDDSHSFLTHALTFEKDRLGKDLTWKKKNEEELVIIDPRERERELGLDLGKKRKGQKGKGREWDRDRDRDVKR